MKREVSEKDLLDGLAALPREIRPGRDPWPAISARIEPTVPAQSHKHLHRHWPLAAVALSALLFLAVVFTLQQRPGASPPLEEQQTAAVHAASRNASPGIRWAAAEQEYLAAFREFVLPGQVYAASASPVLESAHSGWAGLQAVEKELQAALRRHPDDRFLNERMLELRSRQLYFLQRIVAVEGSRRSDLT